MECVYYRCPLEPLFVVTFDDPEDYEGKEWPICADHWNEFTINHLVENKDNVYIRKVEEES